jgi:hypothetical protein
LLPGKREALVRDLAAVVMRYGERQDPGLPRVLRDNREAEEGRAKVL